MPQLHKHFNVSSHYLGHTLKVQTGHLMTLHAAIEKLLRETGRPLTTLEIADRLNANNWYQKKDNSKITGFQIHGRTRNYPQLFNRNETTVSLTGQEPTKPAKRTTVIRKTTKVSKTLVKDEHYVLDLCDKVLNCNSSRQHKFDFLLGDTNKKLPVDAYYEKLNLVIEYRERQHTESVTFFDKPNHMTVSGVHRGEQRKIYDERRRIILPKHNIDLIEISYLVFNHDNQKRIIRDKEYDLEVVSKLLQAYVDRV